MRVTRSGVAHVRTGNVVKRSNRTLWLIARTLLNDPFPSKRLAFVLVFRNPKSRPLGARILSTARFIGFCFKAAEKLPACSR